MKYYKRSYSLHYCLIYCKFWCCLYFLLAPSYQKWFVSMQKFCCFILRGLENLEQLRIKSYQKDLIRSYIMYYRKVFWKLKIVISLLINCQNKIALKTQHICFKWVLNLYMSFSLIKVLLFCVNLHKLTGRQIRGK